jgi:hypothetical protein
MKKKVVKKQRRGNEKDGKEKVTLIRFKLRSDSVLLPVKMAGFWVKGSFSD